MPNLENLSRAVATLGEPEWRPMLAYVAALHALNNLANQEPDGGGKAMGYARR